MTATYRIRRARLRDLRAIKKLADCNRTELGFVLRPVLEKAIRDDEVLVAIFNNRVVGFAHYHHRLDLQTTLHTIAVRSDLRLNGVGRALLHKLIAEASKVGQETVALKCPSELEANRFYFHLGFRCVGQEVRSRRSLKLWHKRVKWVTGAYPRRRSRR